MCLAERARPRAEQVPPVLKRWSSTDTPLALNAAVSEDRHAPQNRYEEHGELSRGVGIRVCIGKVCAILQSYTG